MQFELLRGHSYAALSQPKVDRLELSSLTAEIREICAKRSEAAAKLGYAAAAELARVLSDIEAFDNIAEFNAMFGHQRSPTRRKIGRSAFGLRVSETGRKTFILAARFPGKTGGRRALGAYPVLSLQTAHAKADTWLAIIERGDAPAQIEERERAARLRQRDQTIAMVVEDFKDI